MGPNEPFFGAPTGPATIPIPTLEYINAHYCIVEYIYIMTSFISYYAKYQWKYPLIL
jgi:hypothetical protein